MVQVPKEMTWEIKQYNDHTRHLINTDIDDLLDIEDARRATEQAAEKQEREQQVVEEGAKTDDTPAAALNDAGASQATEGALGGSMEVDEGGGHDNVKRDDEDMPPKTSVTKPSMQYHALCLRFTLPTAAYATMCIREITRQDTSTSFHTSLNTLPAGQHPSNTTSSDGKSLGPGGDAAGSGEGAGVPVGGGVSAKSSVASPKKGAVISVGASFKR